MKGFAIHLVPMAIQVIEAHTSLNFSNCDVVMKVKTYCLIYWVKSLTTYYYCCKSTSRELPGGTGQGNRVQVSSNFVGSSGVITPL